jgi:hypothetical protein|tara:strand:+ start:530 stop:883 length:354 start_codon:yes stop_codon:yes gene_type:complete
MTKIRSKEEKDLAKFIVAKLLPNLSQKRWPQERKMANQLVDKFSNKLFWETLTRPDKLWTLSWFLKDDLGSYYLNDHSITYDKKEKDLSTNYKFKEENIGQDFKTEKKPQNPLDFFK